MSGERNPVKVLAGPVKIDGAAVRAVATDSGGGRLEVFGKDGWAPSTEFNWGEFMMAPPATDEFLSKIGAAKPGN